MSRWPYKTLAIGEDVHTDIRIAAAKAGVSKKEMAERAFRLGLAAGELAEVVKGLEFVPTGTLLNGTPVKRCPRCGWTRGHATDCALAAALAAYDAAQNPQEKTS